MGEAAGNATKAAVLAGYSQHSAAAQASRLLKKRNVRDRIDQTAQNDQAVWTREDRQRFWTAVAQGAGMYADAAMKDRLKASELLGKSQADFIDRHQHEGGIAVDVTGARERLTSTLARIAARAAGRVTKGPQ